MDSKITNKYIGKLIKKTIKILLLAFLLFVITYNYLAFKGIEFGRSQTYEVIPSNTNVTLLIGSVLYNLDKNGLHAIDNLLAYEKNGPYLEGNIFADDNRNKSFFFSTIYFIKDRMRVRSYKNIRKITLFTNNKYHSIPLRDAEIVTEKEIALDGVSPNGELLLVSGPVEDNELNEVVGKKLFLRYKLQLFDIKKGMLTELIDRDEINKYCNSVFWISNHEFVYSTKENKLMKYDVNNFSENDLHMDNYCFGGKVDEQNILLHNRDEIVKYNLYDKSIKKLVNLKGMIPGELVIWLPEAKGLLYTRETRYDALHITEGIGDLMFYSLDKKKEVILQRIFSLYSGTVMPSNIDINSTMNSK